MFQNVLTLQDQIALQGEHQTAGLRNKLGLDVELIGNKKIFT